MIRRILKPHKRWIIPLIEKIQIASIKGAARERGIEKLSKQLAQIVPDINKQYTTFEIDSEFLRVKVRTQHAFQIQLALRALDYIKDKKSIFIVDVGDSSGTHTEYLKGCLSRKHTYF